MTQAETLRWARGHFPRLRRHAVRWVYADTDWYGLFIPGLRSDTILVNLWNHVGEGSVQGEWLRGTLLHELIHCEQCTNGYQPSHGAYFVHRRDELMQLSGVYIPPGTPS